MVDFKSATINLLVVVPVYAGRVHRNPAMAGIGASFTPQLQQVSVGQGNGGAKGSRAAAAAAATQKAAQVQAARDACVGDEPALAAASSTVARNAAAELRRQQRASADKYRPFFFQRKDLASQDRRGERLLQGMMTQVAVQRFSTSKCAWTT